MNTITKWIEKKLGLKVNATKSKVVRPSNLKYLGFGFVKMGERWEARPHKDSIENFKRKLKKLTKRSWSVSMDYRTQRLNQVIRGWINYFRIGKMKGKMAKQSIGFADHYQAVSKTAGLRKISKEILARRGLISCYDYYLN